MKNYIIETTENKLALGHIATVQKYLSPSITNTGYFLVRVPFSQCQPPGIVPVSCYCMCRFYTNPMEMVYMANLLFNLKMRILWTDKNWTLFEKGNKHKKPIFRFNAKISFYNMSTQERNKILSENRHIWLQRFRELEKENKSTSCCFLLQTPTGSAH